MVGLGETDDEIAARARATCARAGVDIVTLGQYLRPTREHAPGRPLRDARRLRALRGAGPRARLPDRLLRRVRALLVQRRGGAHRERRAADAEPPPAARRLAALSGVLLALSFPKFGHGAVAWVALAPLLIALAGTTGLARGFASAT